VIKKKELVYFILMFFAILNPMSCKSEEWAVKPIDPLYSVAEEKFIDAIVFLHYQGDRAKAADMFAEIARKYPELKYGQESQELSDFLRKMVEEDKVWREPEDISKLTVDERISYWVYKLRDVNLVTPAKPSSTHFLDWASDPRLRKDGFKHAGWQLLEIGKPTVPVLIRLLNDRKPTRTVGYTRFTYLSRTIQRYQDAALEILEKILNKKFYGEEGYRSNYFSELSAEHRQKIIAEIKAYWEKTQEKPNDRSSGDTIPNY